MSTAGDQQALENKLQILFDASATLIGSFRMEELLPKVLELARKLNDAEACAIWRQDPATRIWRIASSLGLSAAYRDVAMPTGSAILDQPFCIEDVASLPQTAERRRTYESEGIRALVAMPMRIGGRFSGTLAFYYHEPRRFSETELRVAGALASLAASAVETAELYREQERHRAGEEQARVRAAFLADASAVLASSLDYHATLGAVAHLAVPHIADWCVIDMAQPDGSLQPLVVAHVDPDKVAWASDLSRRFRPNPDADAPSGRLAVLRTGKGAIQEIIDDEMLVKGAINAEHLELVRSLGLTSYMCVPLALRDRVLGTITFVSATPGRHFGPPDLALAEDLARRAAMAIENATLYAEARREREAAEAALAALRENEERLLLAMDAGRLGIWEWDLRTGALKSTENTARRFGMAQDLFPTDAAGLLDTIHPDDRATFLACVDRAVGQKSYFECEFRIFASNGEPHWLAAKGRVFCDEAGEPVRMIGIGLDIDEKRLLEDKLRSAQKLESIGLLAGGIAHDFNNLLTGILGNASLAMELLSSDAEASPLLNNVVEASERAADLTQQLLAYSGKGRFVVEPIDLSFLVREITHLLQATIPKMVTLKLELGANLPAVEADSSQVQQVIMNLVINAAEAIGDASGTVRVRTELRHLDGGQIRESGFSGELQPGAFVCLEVSDDGCGMDADTQKRIFDPFFTTKFTGRGLGLAAVSGIARGHHGAIQVRSALGQGSSFEVLFPAMGAPVTVAKAREDAEDLTGSGLVLVIDDEAAVRATAAASLRRYGYRVEVAQDGGAGVDAFCRRPQEFVAVLLDLTMPVLGGEKALQRIKEIRPDVPVIASSGYSEAEASRRFPPGGFAAFLQKPYSAAGLARQVKAVIHRLREHRDTHHA